MTAAPKRRRWFQFGLRALLALTLLASVGMSWLGVQIHRAKREAAAVEAIRAAGGSVWYDYQFDRSGRRDSGATCPGPLWLRRVFGVDFFCRVAEVHVNNDASLTSTKGLDGLESLRIGCSAKLTDTGLATLDDLPSVRRLWFGINKNITDAGMVHLRSLKRLERLELHYSHLTDAGLEHLEGLPQLEDLSLGKGITDAGVPRLAQLHTLRSLDLRHTNITRDGVRTLKQALPECEIVR